MIADVDSFDDGTVVVNISVVDVSVAVISISVVFDKCSDSVVDKSLVDCSVSVVVDSVDEGSGVVYI